MLLINQQYNGLLYRALNPIYAKEPLSAEGAIRFGGRFNAKGTPALYTSLDPTTAMREANQVGSLQPTILVSYQAQTGPIFDARSRTLLEKFALSFDKLADDGWRQKMLDGEPVPTQQLAKELLAKGYQGLLTPSFAPGAHENALNMVLWEWNSPESTLTLIDDENRIKNM